MSHPSEDDAERLRARVSELEVLRARTHALVAELRTEQQQASDTLDEMKRHNEQLQQSIALAMEQVEMLIFERGELETHCHRLEEAVREARGHACEAALTLHAQLFELAGDTKSLARPEERRFIASSASLAKTALEQLDAVTNELATLTTRASRGRSH